MVDTLSLQERSKRMSLVKSKDTKPEIKVRRLVHSLGYRYRLHKAGIPGKPDLVFSSRKKVIFVHGCFWHRHGNCKLARMPKSRLDFWQPKLEANLARDLENQKKLSNLGWRFMIVWECELGDEMTLRKKITSFLGKVA